MIACIRRVFLVLILGSIFICHIIVIVIIVINNFPRVIVLHLQAARFLAITRVDVRILVFLLSLCS